MTRSLFSSTGTGRRLLLPLLMLMPAMTTTGCRRPPANPPVLYEAERIELEEAARAKKATEGRRFLSDRYPWGERRRRTRDLPERIVDAHKRIKAEMELLRLVIYGPRKRED